MVTVLSPDIIQMGKQLLERLDKAQFSIKAAFWLYSSDSNRWRLVFASPSVAQSGPKQFYRAIQSNLLRSPHRDISLSDVAVVDSSAPLILLLATAIRTGPGISDIRFTHNFINGVLVEDAYIYRLV
jgi:hypothetical protein